MNALTRRQSAAVILLFLFGASAMLFFLPVGSMSLKVWQPGMEGNHSGKACATEGGHPPSRHNYWNPKQYVMSPSVSGRFRDNLRPDLNYITTFCVGGFTNLFMCYANLVYLATLSNRVPVIPAFIPSHHISHEAGMIDFSEIFDIEYLRTAISGPVLEWSDLKSLPKNIDAPSFATTETLGCWGARADDPTGSRSYLEHLHLDVSYANFPDEMFVNSRPDPHVKMWHVAALVYPETPLFEDRQYGVQWPSKTGLEMQPDKHMVCFDTTYFLTTGATSFEWQRAWAPAWRYVGVHMRFTKGMDELADKYARKAFDLALGEQIPPYISVHIRRADFARGCEDPDPQKCFTPLSTFASAVEDVKQELKTTQQLDITHVLISSDEEDPAFWADVATLGWRDVDHAAEQTLERFGEWYPPIIDVVMQSHAHGFVGSSDSTFSLVSARRVQDWNGGATRTVKWGSSNPADV